MTASPHAQSQSLASPHHALLSWHLCYSGNKVKTHRGTNYFEVVTPSYTSTYAQVNWDSFTCVVPPLPLLCVCSVCVCVCVCVCVWPQIREKRSAIAPLWPICLPQAEHFIPCVCFDVFCFEVTNPFRLHSRSLHHHVCNLTPLALLPS